MTQAAINEWEERGTDEPLDQQVDLGAGWWGAIGPDGREGHRAFTWVVYDHWIDDDEPVIGGEADSEEAAKQAVMDSIVRCDACGKIMLAGEDGDSYIVFGPNGGIFCKSDAVTQATKDDPTNA